MTSDAGTIRGAQMRPSVTFAARAATAAATIGVLAFATLSSPAAYGAPRQGAAPDDTPPGTRAAAADWANRAAGAYDALQSNLFLGSSGHGLFVENAPVLPGENPYSYLWTFREATEAAMDVADVPGVGRRYTADAAARFTSLQSYAGFDAEGYPGYESAVAPPLGGGGDVFYDDNAIIGLSYFQRFQRSHDPADLAHARSQLSVVLRGWDTDPSATCPGGLNWIASPANTTRQREHHGPRCAARGAPLRADPRPRLPGVGHPALRLERALPQAVRRPLLEQPRRRRIAQPDALDLQLRSDDRHGHDPLSGDVGCDLAAAGDRRRPGFARLLDGREPPLRPAGRVQRDVLRRPAAARLRSARSAVPRHRRDVRGSDLAGEPRRDDRAVPIRTIGRRRARPRDPHQHPRAGGRRADHGLPRLGPHPLPPHRLSGGCLCRPTTGR
ncbi:hypothetical protein FJ657_02320 [Schumannella soli]|uniref:Uncharacterized protein n=1 Tax=Schumannella soli TaxID=2590779 RepID=A0A506XXA6_9MICO|nr:hypothetical protein FJ657_02320 [Schumannella soli]